MEAAASELEAGFVEIAIADDGVVLKGDVEVAGLGKTCARAGVLSEDLVLRSGGWPVTSDGETPKRRKELLRLFQR